VEGFFLGGEGGRITRSRVKLGERRRGEGLFAHCGEREDGMKLMIIFEGSRRI
jgi:hypothetical protein